ncbi:MAG TPA: di-heme oxidoredictase family protein, partial [Myxococcaceae bacterium]|nr:di-heme oxidoredictase family protein [Myxococcaceae bacterium]
WQTGSNPVPALSNKTFHPYSDFLLHDMGSLGDGITQNLATGRLMRTAPLWGLRVQTKLLHDGRADDPDANTRLTQAIAAHAASPEAAASEFNFSHRISPSQRADILNFLNSL